MQRYTSLTKTARRCFSSGTANRVEMSKSIIRFDPVDANGATDRISYRGPLKSIILDWSGTTADAHVLAPAVVFYEVFSKHGVPISMAEAREPMGLRKDLHIAKILEIPQVRQRWIDIKGSEPDQSTVDTLFKDFVPMQLEVLPRYTTLLPGTAETTQLFREKYNLSIGSTTGFTRSMVDVLIADAKKQGYTLDYSVAGDDVENNMGFRPAPFMIYKNLVNLGCFPVEACVKVDDTVSGVGEGLNAGCWSIGVWGWSNYTDIDSLEQWDAMSDEEKFERREGSRLKLETSGAHYVIETLNEMPIVLEDINERLKRGEKPQSTFNPQMKQY